MSGRLSLLGAGLQAPAAGGAANDFLTSLNAYWKLNEASPATPWVDSHSNGYDWDVENGTGITMVSGKSGNAINFANAESIQIANAGGMGFDNLSKFSVSMWLQFNSGAGGTNDILVMWDTAGAQTNYRCFRLYTAAGIDLRMQIAATGDEGGNTTYAHIDSALSETTTYHIVWVYDGTESVQADRCKFYVDGSEVTTGKSVTGTIPASTIDCDSTVELEMGSQRDNSSANMDGWVDECAFWSGRAITSSEASDLYNSGTGLFFDDFE